LFKIIDYEVPLQCGITLATRQKNQSERIKWKKDHFRGQKKEIESKFRKRLAKKYTKNDAKDLTILLEYIAVLYLMES
jgi:hypothetical protein